MQCVFECVAGLKIVYLNIRSVIHKLEILELFLRFLQCRVDIVVLVETWMLPGEELFFELTGYVSHHQPRNTRKTRGGGISIYTATYLQHGKTFGSVQDEVQFLGVQLIDYKFSIIAFYRPPPANNLQTFYSNLDFLLDSQSRSIVMGDANINLLREEDFTVVQYRSILEMNSYHLLNKLSPEYATRVTETGRSIIDHAFSNIPELQNASLSLGETHISDHQYLLLDTETERPRTTSHLTYTKIDFSKLTPSLLQQIATDPEFDLFHRKLIENSTIETFTKISDSSARNKKPWFTATLKSIKREQQKFYKLQKNYPLNPLFKEEYHRFNHLLKKTVKKEKVKFFKSQISENIDDPSKLWQISKQIISNNFSQNSNPKIHLLVNDLQVSDSKQVGDHLNTFFTSVSSIIKSSITAQNCDSEFFPTKNVDSPLTNFSPTTPDEIIEIIHSLKHNSSPGYDRISVKFIKDNNQFFADYLSKSINHMFTTGKYPNSLKQAIVTPIFKKGSKQDPNNYRPISVLSVFAKVFDTVIRNRLIEYLTTNNLISDKQFGFMKNKSTTSATSCFIDEVVKKLNQKLKCSSSFLDIQKAFDCMDYKILKRILIRYGITGLALDIIMNFLQDRSQRVKIGGVLSDSMPIVAGLPQGCCLVVLFLIYLNDFLCLELHGKAQLFCDDAEITYGAIDYPSLKIQMEEDLQKVISFFESRFLVVNPSKTKFLIFRTRNSSLEGIFSSLEARQMTVQVAQSHDYLGLVLDPSLMWHNHVNKVLRKASPYVGLLRRLKPYLTTSLLWQMYYSYIHSHLIYLIPVWGWTSTQRMLSLQRIQNKSIKAIRGLPRLTSTMSLYSPELLPVKKLPDYESILFIYKLVNGLQTIDREMLTNLSVVGRITRQAGALRPPNYVLGVAQGTVLFRGVQLYNSFISSPYYISGVPLHIFKRTLKQYIFNS